MARWDAVYASRFTLIGTRCAVIFAQKRFVEVAIFACRGSAASMLKVAVRGQ
jgi:hypothetical protein